MTGVARFLMFLILLITFAGTIVWIDHHFGQNPVILMPVLAYGALCLAISYFTIPN